MYSIDSPTVQPQRLHNALRIRRSIRVVVAGQPIHGILGQARRTNEIGMAIDLAAGICALRAILPSRLLWPVSILQKLAPLTPLAMDRNF